MKYAISGWLNFLGGLLILGSADYYMRWRDGWLGGPSLPTPDVVWFNIPLLLSAISLVLLWRATATFPRLWIRISVVMVQAFIGYVIYCFACLWYVISTGIDCL